MTDSTLFSLDQVRTMLRYGSTEQAAACLEQLQKPQASSFPASEMLYLQVWALSMCGLSERAALLLLPTAEARQDSRVAEALQGTDLRRKAPIWFLLGELARQGGSDNDALSHYRRCLSALDERRMNLPFLRLLTLCACGSICLRQRTFADACDFFMVALPLCGDDQERLPCLRGLCEAHLGLGAYAQVRQWTMQALPLARTLDDGLAQMALLSWLAEALAGLGDLTAALGYAQDACDLARTLTRVDLEVESLASLARLHFQQAAYPQTRETCLRALRLAQEHPVKPQVVGALRRIAGDSLHQGLFLYEPESEEWTHLVRQIFSWYLGAALSFQQCRAWSKQAEVYHQAASFALEVGKPDMASDYLRRANEALFLKTR